MAVTLSLVAAFAASAQDDPPQHQHEAERILARSIKDTPPDLEHAAYLAAVRATIAKLHLIFASQN